VTTIFDTIDRLVPSLVGWCSVPKAFTLARAVLAMRPDVTVEIGVFGGRSLLPMALAHRQIGKGKIVGIDPWSASASIVGQLCPNDAVWWGQCDHEQVYKEFMGKVEMLGLQKWVNIIHKNSDEVEPPQIIDLFHLDGNHGEQAHKDAQRFAPNMRVGGLCFLDDIEWTGGGVKRASQFIESIGFVELFRQDTGAMYQRIA